MVTLLEFVILGTAHITLDRVEKINSITIEDVYSEIAVVHFVPKMVSCDAERNANEDVE